MSFMADLLGLMWRHPFISCLAVLLLFAPPFYPVLRFFSPLLISTAVFVVVVLIFGPALERKAHRDGEAHMKRQRGRRQEGENVRGFWEEQVKPQKEGNWFDEFVLNFKIRLHAWLEQMLRNDDVLHRLKNEGPVNLPEKEASRSGSGSGSSRRSSLKNAAASDKDTGSHRSSKRGVEVTEVRSTHSDLSSDEEEDLRSSTRSSSRRFRAGEVMEVRSIGKNEQPSDDDSDHSARSRGSSRKRPGSRKAAASTSRSNSVKGLRYDGDTEELVARPGEEAIGGADLSRSLSKSRSNSRSKSLRNVQQDSDFDTDEDDRLQEEAVTMHQKLMAKSRSNSRSNSGKIYKYEGSPDFNTDEDARLQQEAVERHLRAKLRSRSSRGGKYDGERGVPDPEEGSVARRARSRSNSRSNFGKGMSIQAGGGKYDGDRGVPGPEEGPVAVRARSRSNSRSNSGKGMSIQAQVALNTDSSDDEPRLVAIARRPTSRAQQSSRSDSIKGSLVTHSGSDEARQADWRSESRTSSRSNSGNGRNNASTTSETDGYDEGRIKDYRQNSSFRSAHGSMSRSGRRRENAARVPPQTSGNEDITNDFSKRGTKVSADHDFEEGDSGGSHSVRANTLLKPLDPAAAQVRAEAGAIDLTSDSRKLRSGTLQPIESSAPRPLHNQSSYSMPEQEEKRVAGSAAKGSAPAGTDSEEDGSSSSEEERGGAVPSPMPTTALPGRLVRALSRELKAHIDEKLVVPSEQPEKKMERLQTLHHEISGILNNFSIHEEEEKLASVLGGLSAFIGGDSEEEGPRTELLPKRWTSKPYTDVDILPETPSVKRLTDNARDSQKLEMLKLYGHLLQEKREDLTRQDSASSLA